MQGRATIPMGLGAVSRRTILLVLALFVLAGSVRFYHIEWSYSNNGIDEGIMLGRSLLVSKGYALYSELPCDQAPLAFYIGAILDGDLLGLRILQASLSLVAMAACMGLARRLRGNSAMLVTGLLLSLDFAFLRESRLFSLDGLSSYLMAFALLAFVIYIQKDNRLSLAASSILIGLSAATKLFGALVLAGMLMFMVHERAKGRGGRRPGWADFSVLIVGAAIPMAAFMAYLGPSEMLDGMLFSQGHREFDPFLKLSIPAYFGLNLAYLLPIARARDLCRAGPETRFLILASAIVLAFMLLQPLTFFHHLAFLSPLLATLAGIVIASILELEKEQKKEGLAQDLRSKGVKAGGLFLALFLSGIVVSGGLAFYGLAAQGEPAQVRYAEILREISAPGDWVISGDPLICAYAGRMIPPEMVNVAYRQYPELTLEDVEQAIRDYNVSTVIVCYMLNDMDGLREVLAANNYTELGLDYGAQGCAVLDLFQEGLGPVAFYVRASS